MSKGITGQRGFSLLELLSVMAMVSMIAAMTLPALRGMLDGYSISGAADLASADLSLARQAAISRNLPVEVRIYSFDEGFGEAWRVIGVVIPSAASGQVRDEWITPGRVLPGGIIMEDSGDFSTIISRAESTPGAGVWTGTESASAPRLVRGRPYVAFQFRPDGSTSLPSNQPWCLTLKSANSRADSESPNRPSANFGSIVLDAKTGRTMFFQP
jgi:uncharacterized protein (TIGR02596 family)